MPVRFACQNCRQLLSVSARKTGSQVKCPKCQTAVTVPSAEDAAALLAMMQTVPAPPPERIDLSQIVVYDEAPAVAAPGPLITPVRQEDLPVDRSLVAISRRVLYAQAVLLLVVALVAFLSGYLIGRGVAPESTEPITVLGTISHQADGEDVLPDSGAVVVALPKGRFPASRIPIEGIRPDEAESAETAQAIRELGGAVARTGQQGHFQLQLRPGKYQVLMISNQQPPVEEQPKPEHIAVLGRYFESAADLLDGSRYSLVERQFPNDGSLDHRFRRGP